MAQNYFLTTGNFEVFDQGEEWAVMEFTRASICSGYSGKENYAVLAALGRLPTTLRAFWSSASGPSPTVFVLKRVFA
jgi:hypothetical protein